MRLGGSEIYLEALPLASKLYMTVVKRRDGRAIKGNTYFPEQWPKYFPPHTLVEDKEVQDNPDYHLSFRLYSRQVP